MGDDKIAFSVTKPMVVRKAFFLFFEKNAQKTPQKNAQKKRPQIKKNAQNKNAQKTP